MTSRVIDAQRRATLQDIAETAGVSISTVSLVLANKAQERRISGNVIERVRKVAVDLDYSPNAVARSLQGGRSHTISFFNGFRHLAQADDIYMDKMSAGIQIACGELGYDLLISCDYTRPAEETYRYLNSGRCDGLILFAAGAHEPLLPYLQASRLPTVLLNSIDTTGKLATVAEDDVSGMSQMADLLGQLGHRRIAIFGHTVYPNPDSIQRVELLRKFLGAHGVDVPDRWVLSTGDDGHIYPEEDLDRILAEPEPPTVVFCWHDRLGYRVLEHCYQRGIRIPDEISIIGYDGLRWPSSSHHHLASVVVDIPAIARQAVTILNSQINNLPNSSHLHLVPVSIDRGTTLRPVSQ